MFCKSDFIIILAMKIIAKNKRGYFDYDIEQTWDAGIILQWHEVKACKMDHCTITEALIRLDDKTKILNIINMDIPLYSKTQHNLASGYIPKRSRGLLLNQKELTRIYASMKQWNGMTLIPLELFEATNRRLKIKIWLGKIRRKVEKKQILKEKDIDRQMRKDIKEY